MAAEREPRKRTSSRAPSLAPLYGGIGIAILAIVAIALAKKAEKSQEDKAESTEAPAEEKTNPFEGFEDTQETPPTAEGEKKLEPSSADLLSTAVWIKALETGTQGSDTLKLAIDAKEQGNQTKYVELAVKARDFFEKALDDTVDWEIEIVEKHGESDSRVTEVLSQRGRWFASRKKLRKVDV